MITIKSYFSLQIIIISRLLELFLFQFYCRLIESDAKSLNSLSGPSSCPGQDSKSGHSRKSSLTSQISTNSSNDQTENGEESLWTTWGKIINEWDSGGKKKLPLVKVIVLYIRELMKIAKPGTEHFVITL